jgi:hypothetical protein
MNVSAVGGECSYTNACIDMSNKTSRYFMRFNIRFCPERCNNGIKIYMITGYVALVVIEF